MTVPTHEQIEVFLGVDVGKGQHHAVAVSRTGTILFDRTLPNDETRVRELIGTLTQHGPTILVVDQPATIGALAVAVAQDMGIAVGYLPGLAMRRIADLYPGEAKTELARRRVARQTHRERSTAAEFRPAATDPAVGPTTPGCGSI
jgi:hypothetical protein